MRTAAAYEQLDQDWYAVVRYHPEVPVWWAVAGVPTGPPDEVVANVWQDDTTAVMLLQLAQDKDELAARLLLQAMARRLAWFAGRSSRHELAEFVSAAWERIATYPAASRNSNVLTNLTMDCLKSVSRAGAKGARELSVEQPPEPPEPAGDGFPCAAEIIDLAERRALVPTASIAVLRSVYSQGLSGAQAAELHGMSPEMVRYRCSSAIKKLRNYRQELLEAA
jgi:DNA-directed RNA polymerase specialized sigma24 family protein